MDDRKGKTVKAQDKKQDEGNIEPGLSQKCCILMIGTNGLRPIGGVYESEAAALGSLKKAGATGDFILLPVTTL